MRAIRILLRFLGPCLVLVHLSRLRALLTLVDALVAGERLSLTALGRSTRFGMARHNIKRADRLLGNRKLHSEVVLICKAVATHLLAGPVRPVILVDWTAAGFRQDALVAALAVGGRALPLYFEVHPRSDVGKDSVHTDFLKHLFTIVPVGCRPVIVTDAGFRNPWFRAVRGLGWDFVGRLGGAVMVSRAEASSVWEKTSSLFPLAVAKCGHPVDLGKCRVAQSRPLAGRAVLYFTKARGRHGSLHVTHKGVHPSSSAYKKYQRRGREPWALVTSLSDDAPEMVVACYKRRFQIEETFRQAKSHRFGWCFEDARSRDNARLGVLLLIAMLAMLAVALVGWLAEQHGMQYQLQASSTKKRRVLSVLRLGQTVIQQALDDAFEEADFRRALEAIQGSGAYA